MSHSETPNDIERKLKEKAAEKAALLFANHEVHTEDNCPARLEFGLGVNCALHPEPKPTQLKKMAISCAIAASTSLAITMAAIPATSAPPIERVYAAVSGTTLSYLRMEDDSTADKKSESTKKSSKTDSEGNGKGTKKESAKKESAKKDDDSKGSEKDKGSSKKTDSDKESAKKDGKDSAKKDTKKESSKNDSTKKETSKDDDTKSGKSYWRIFGKRDSAKDSKGSSGSSESSKKDSSATAKPSENQSETGNKPTPIGPNENNRTQSSSLVSPKVGVGLAPSEDLTTAWRAKLDENAEDSEIKTLKGASVPSTLTRAQTVGLTAWLLGDWSTFDGTYSNGNVPEDNLKDLLTVRGHELRHDAAIMFDLMCVDFIEEFGHPIGLTDSYRPYASQVTLKANKPGLAAEPGTSNHGWGLAIDLNGQAGKWDTPERDWLIENGWKYGWFSPTWAQQGTSRPEPWHFEYMGTTEIAWPTSKEALERIDELNGDPLQGLFVEDIINSLLGKKSTGSAPKSTSFGQGETESEATSDTPADALKRTEEMSRLEEQQTGSVILNQGILP